MPKGKFTPFTKQQEDYIKREYLNKPVKRLAQDVNCSFGRVMRFLKKNNLHIPKEIVEQRKAQSRMSKGHTPFNKGKKQEEYMSFEAIQKSKNTRYKKGHTPHNTKTKDGVISIRKDSCGRCYKYIRLGKGVWELYHRVLWEQENGPIPSDKIVSFKDENSLNVCIENLQLITREENMYRNAKHNYPREIIPSMVLMNQIDKKIKNLQNG